MWDGDSEGIGSKVQIRGEKEWKAATLRRGSAGAGREAEWSGAEMGPKDHLTSG